MNKIKEVAMRRRKKIALVAHDQCEFTAMQELLPGRPVFYSADYHDYFSFYSRCAGGILNRVHGAVLLDAMGKVLRPAILWNDGRSGPQCAEITERAGGLESLLAMVANPALAGFTATEEWQEAFSRRFADAK